MSLFRAMLLPLALAAASIGGSAQAAGAPADAAATTKALSGLGDLIKRGDCPRILQVIAAQVASPGFPLQVELVRAQVYGLATSCALQQRDADLARRYAHEGTRLDLAPDMMWTTRFMLDGRVRDADAALLTLEEMATRRPTALGALEPAPLWELDRMLTAKSDASGRRRLFKILAGPAYQPDDPMQSGDGFRRNYAEILVDSGDKIGAEALIRAIRDPRTLMQLSVDPRFRALLPKDFDGRDATERDLAHMRDVAISHPGLLGPSLAVASDLQSLGRSEEALRVLEAARPVGDREKSYSDLAKTRNWWWDQMALTYGMLGRYAEAADAYRQGMALTEMGAPNVSQIINLAATQLRFGRYDEALATLVVIDADKRSLSSYGQMALRSVRGCASAAAGKMDAARADLAYAVAHRTDAPGVVGDLQLCLGDLDAAAAALVHDLDDPARRSATLLALCDYDDPPAAVPPDSLAARTKALRARSDVQAAVARAGGTRRFHVVRDVRS